MAPGGYSWWYVDALSEDGRFGLVIIAFIGSVFSPYYAWSGRADPLDHCAINVALYTPGPSRWAMTERRRAAVSRDASMLTIGPSSFCWENGGLTIRFDEITAPAPTRLRGTVRLEPLGLVARDFALDARSRHWWRPISPRAAVEVSLEGLNQGWRGEGYFDTNWGAEPLEDAFMLWDWSRAHLARDTLLLYDVVPRDGAPTALAFRVNAAGEVLEVEAPPRMPLASTFWRLARTTRGDLGDPPRLARTLEDTPFYARSMLKGRLAGEEARIIHESLDLVRLRSPVVRAMLPFRMPRRVW